MDLVAVLTRYVAVSFFIKSRMGRIPDTKMELVSLWVFIISRVCKAELRASRRTGAAYCRTACITDLYMVMSIFVYVDLILRCVMALIMLNLESTLRFVSTTRRVNVSLLSTVIPRYNYSR